MAKARKLRSLEEIKEVSRTVYTYSELAEKLGITCMTLFSWLEMYYSKDRNDIKSTLKANREKREKEENIQKLKDLKLVSQKSSSFKELELKTGISNPKKWICENFPDEISIIKTNLKANRRNRENKEQYKVISQKMEEIKEISKEVYSFKELTARVGIKYLSENLSIYFPKEKNEIKSNLAANREKRDNEEMKQKREKDLITLEKVKDLSKVVSTFKELSEAMGISSINNWLDKNFPEERLEIEANLKANQKKGDNENNRHKQNKNLIILEIVKEISLRVSTFKEISEEAGISNISSWLTQNFPEEKAEIRANLAVKKEEKDNERKRQKQNENLIRLEKAKKISMRVFTINELSQEIGVSGISKWLEQNFPEEKEEIKANLDYNRQKKKKASENQSDIEKIERIKEISQRVCDCRELAKEMHEESHNIDTFLKKFPETNEEIKANIKANRLKEKEKIEREYLELARKASKRAYSITEIAEEIKINVTSLSNSLKKFPEIKEEVQNNITTNKAEKNKFELDEIELRENHMIFHTRDNSIAEVWRFYHTSPLSFLKQNQEIEIEKGDYILVAQYDPITNCIILMGFEIYLENSKIVKVKYRKVQDDMRIYHNEKIQNFADKAKEILGSKIK